MNYKDTEESIIQIFILQNTMQAIEDNQKYDFMRDGILKIHKDNKYPEDVNLLFKQFESTEALKYVHTISVCTNVLCERDDLMVELQVFANKTDKLTKILLEQRKTDGKHYNIDCVIDCLQIFKNVTNVELILANDEYSVDEISALRKYFDGPICIKNLQLKADYYVICNVMESIGSAESIKTVDLTMRNIKGALESMLVPITHKIKKLTFANCTIQPSNEDEFNIFLEKFLVSNPSIIELYLWQLPININTVRTIADIIKGDNLRTLSMWRCGIDDEKIDILTCALETSSVVQFDVFNNDIEHEGALRIAALLKLNESLTSVCFDNNPLSYVGTIEIIKSLALNSTVNKFSCHIKVHALTESIESITRTFEEILENNYTLVDFYVGLQIEDTKWQASIELKPITDRNEGANYNSRFIKTKDARNE